MKRTTDDFAKRTTDHFTKKTSNYFVKRTTDNFTKETSGVFITQKIDVGFLKGTPKENGVFLYDNDDGKVKNFKK